MSGNESFLGYAVARTTVHCGVLQAIPAARWLHGLQFQDDGLPRAISLSAAKGPFPHESFPGEPVFVVEGATNQEHITDPQHIAVCFDRCRN
jgi:hypothetical protein